MNEYHTYRGTKALALVAQATYAERHDLEGYFEAKPIEPKWMAEALTHSRHGRVTHCATTNRYTLHIHGNLWYEFTI